jgi:hypothetical protein
MLIIQNISAALSPATYATTKIVDKEIGLKLGEQVEIFGKGDTLFYTQDHQLNLSTGFKRMETRKVFLTQKRAQISFPPKWLKEYCSDVTHVMVFYTKIGLFIKPYKGEIEC